MNKETIIALFLAICTLFTLAACGETNEELLSQDYDESVEEIIDEPIYDMPLLNNGEEQPPLANFIGQIPTAFKANDEKALAELIATEKFNIITVYGGEGVVYKVAHQNKNELTIKDGKLMYNDPEVNPSEFEVGLNVDIFSEAEITYQLTEQKEGLLENIDWDKVDKDYLTAHFHAFYDQMAWLIDEWNINNWVVYKLTNDTYLYTKGYSSYSEGWGARVFVGQSFVIKHDGYNYGIVAYIDAK